MTIVVSSFKWVPDFARGQVRDLRVRWVLEEAGRPYENRLIDFETKETPAYRAQQPFGQVPVYEEAGLSLFESGAIVLHIAQSSPALMPEDPAGRARAMAWVFAALNSMEQYIQGYAELDAFHAGADWMPGRKAAIEPMLRKRLSDLAAHLKDRDWLDDGRFTVGDLMMATVLRILEGQGFVEAEPVLVAYQARCLGRPGFRKALADQLASFADKP
jgi:glutathione S-transferase